MCYHLQADNLTCDMELSSQSFGLVEPLHLCCTKWKEFPPFLHARVVNMDSAKSVMSLLLIRALLIISGDVEVNPGPGKRGQSDTMLEYLLL